MAFFNNGFFQPWKVLANSEKIFANLKKYFLKAGQGFPNADNILGNASKGFSSAAKDVTYCRISDFFVKNSILQTYKKGSPNRATHLPL